MPQNWQNRRSYERETILMKQGKCRRIKAQQLLTKANKIELIQFNYRE